MSAVPSNGDREPSKYERAAALLSPEAREALIAVSARVGISEDDPLYSVLLAQSELFRECMPAQQHMRQAGLDVSHLTIAVKELTKRCDAISDTMTRVEDVTRKNVRIALLFALVAGMVLMFLCLLAVDWMTGGFRILVSLRG
ncbi:MAG: hypothetical protein JO279_02235 [Verrucomicrobia bacterium]|nr:hypothetical protein [Verrucomicrobiota bacterium]